MSVHIAKKHHLVFLVVILNKFLCEVDCRVKQARRIRPATIKVASNHITPIVTYDDPIRVQHRHDFEDESFSKQLSFFVVLLQ